MAIGDKYKANYLDYTVKVIFEDEEGKLLEHISGTLLGGKFYALNNYLESNFTLIKEPRKTEKRYAIVYECKDGSLFLGHDLHSQRHDAEWSGKCHLYNKFHSILEVQYTEEL